MLCCLFNRVWLCATLWAVAHQAPLSIISPLLSRFFSSPSPSSSPSFLFLLLFLSLSLTHTPALVHVMNRSSSSLCYCLMKSTIFLGDWHNRLKTKRQKLLPNIKKAQGISRGWHKRNWIGNWVWLPKDNSPIFFLTNEASLDFVLGSSKESTQKDAEL